MSKNATAGNEPTHATVSRNALSFGAIGLAAALASLAATLLAPFAAKDDSGRYQDAV